MNELSLFSGGGGGLLASYMLGPRTTGYQKHRVSRIMLLGNGQVPTQAFFCMGNIE